jgi:hypothetical protein
MSEFNFLTTHVGSVPHSTLNDLIQNLHDTLDIPAWPQLPHRSFHESMYAQYSPTLPAICEDAIQEKIFFNTSADITDALESFYTPVLSDAVENFALRPDYAHGFFAMLETLRQTEGQWAKGQVTGPISFGFNSDRSGSARQLV